MPTSAKGKLYSGRFHEGLLPELEGFSRSLEMDVELAPYDIAGSIAHARGLRAAGHLTKAQLRSVEKGLKQVGEEIAGGKFVFQESDEDIHTAVERRHPTPAPASTPAAPGTTRWRWICGSTVGPPPGRWSWRWRP